MLIQTHLNSAPRGYVFCLSTFTNIDQAMWVGWENHSWLLNNPSLNHRGPLVLRLFFFLRVHKKSHKAFIYNCPLQFSRPNERYACCPLRAQGGGGQRGQPGSGQGCMWPHVEHPGLWAGDRAQGRIFIEFYNLISKVTWVMYINCLAIFEKKSEGGHMW